MRTPTIAMAAPPRESVAFAITMQNVLEHLRCGGRGAALRHDLGASASLLNTGAIRFDQLGDDVRVNEHAVPPHVSRGWRELFVRTQMTAVQFSRQTSERELLLFMALASAPGTAGSFHRVWVESGAWRIHVTTGDEPSDGSATTSASGTADSADALSALCAQVTSGTAPSPSLLARLERFGAAASKALIDALCVTTNACHRRRLFEMIIALGGGADHLIALLANSNWHVVRNAVALLGELHVVHADEFITPLLHHREARVRIAAVVTLGQLDSEASRIALVAATADEAVDVRAQTWRTLAFCESAPPVNTVDTALRREDTDAVKRGVLQTVAAFADVDVDAALVRFCARETSRGGNPELVSFALELLARRRPESASAFLKRLPQLWVTH